MRNKTILEDLDAKISLLVEQHTKLKDENKRLKTELETLQRLVEVSREELQKLQDEGELKDLELEDIVEKINHALGMVQEEKNVA